MLRDPEYNTIPANPVKQSAKRQEKALTTEQCRQQALYELKARGTHAVSFGKGSPRMYRDTPTAVLWQIVSKEDEGNEDSGSGLGA
jgi:hypothetical protein